MKIDHGTCDHEKPVVWIEKSFRDGDDELFLWKCAECGSYASHIEVTRDDFAAAGGDPDDHPGPFVFHAGLPRHNSLLGKAVPTLTFRG